MSRKVCTNGHEFEKTSSCPICPTCSAQEMHNKFGEEFPSIGAPAFRAIDTIGIRSLHDLSKYTEKELLDLHGFGPKALSLLSAALQEKELTFKA